MSITPIPYLLFAAFTLASCNGEARPPDVIVITIDTLRVDRLPFHGGSTRAPHLSDLADRSLVFERCWSTSSWTAPATASLFTGVYPNQHGVITGLRAYEQLNDRISGMPLPRVPAGLDSLPVLLRDRGYTTFGITDNPNVSALQGFGNGFDHFTCFDYSGAATVNETLARWIDRFEIEGPRFVYLHYMDPHAPYHRRDPWYREEIESDADDDLARYESEIGHVDHFVGEALEMLDAGSDTLVIVVADHGEEFGDHGGKGHPFTMYSELIHVPLLVHLPGSLYARGRVAADVSVVDVLPTIREVVGAPASADDAGISLLGYVDPDRTPAARTIFSMRTKRGPGWRSDKFAVIHEGRKLIGTSHNGRLELYDLVADPHETFDLRDREPAVVQDLFRRWQTFHEGAPTWDGRQVELPVDEATLESLRELGYAGTGTGDAPR